MAFVLVQHLDPLHESHLSEILGRTTTMPVRQITDGMKIEPNSVYVIPPNSNITLSGYVLHLTPRITRTLNLPIDCLFKSLALEQGKNSVGIILSGSGSDGTEGLKAIKKEGGTTFVQTESGAQSEAMPHSAIASGAADFVLSPKEIAHALATIPQHPHNSTAREELGSEPPPDEQLLLAKICQLVLSSTAVDFSHYKQPTVLRRIGRRMIVTRSQRIGEYLAYLEAHPEEIQALYRDLLISVTHFFRDPDSFGALTKCLGDLLKKKPPKSSFRVWVAGCATGEEVYSLAICLDELFRQEGVHPTLQIFGTDLSNSALATARAGSCPDTIAQEVSAERLLRYFHKTDDGRYQINKPVRELCVFAKQDLTRDPPFSRVDLISCRNTLVYLDELLQKKLLSTFHYSLLEGGLIFLGPSETTGESFSLFQPVDAKNKIFVRNSDTPATSTLYTVRPAQSTHPPNSQVPVPVTQDWRKQADQLVQDRYTPAGVIINQELTIFQVRGRTSYYLQSPAIAATKNLLLLAHDDLEQPLREAALSAIAQNIPVQRKGLHLTCHGEARDDAPILMLDNDLLLRRFTPAAQQHFHVGTADIGHSIGEIAQWKHVSALPRMVADVIANLAVSTNELQDDQGSWWSAIIRPYRTVSNHIEGAVLTFTNIDSLKRSLDISEAARKYAVQIVDTVREPLLVLDGELHVITASRAFYQTFFMSPDETLGKFIYDLGDGQWNIPALRTLLEDIVRQRKSFEDFEVSHDFPTLGPRVLLLNARRLRTDKGQSDFVLLSLDDVTERKRLQKDLEASNEDLQRFAYAAAHDLRSPLNSSLRVSQLLAESLAGKLDEFESRMLTLFVESLERLRKLMEDILTYSGMGHTPQNLEVLLLDEPLQIALANLHHNIESSHAQITVGGLPKLPVDSSRIAMVFQNLIDNALKYRREETPRIDIAAVRQGTQWRISVKDNGQGFKGEYASKVFEPFKRLSESDVAGSGIGLATCKRIVERLGGRIWAESTPGTGATFFFTLPAETAIAATAK
jgi:two-component system CheB/CheR fusion protein